MSDLLLNKVHDEVRAQLSPAEQDDFDKFLNRMAKDTRPSLRPRNTDFVSLGDALAPIRKKAEALAAQGDPDAIKRLERMNRARDRVAQGETLPPISPIKCRACGDAGAVYPPLKEGERERRSIPCHLPSLAVRRLPLRIAAIMPRCASSAKSACMPATKSPLSERVSTPSAIPNRATDCSRRKARKA